MKALRWRSAKNTCNTGRKTRPGGDPQRGWTTDAEASEGNSHPEVAPETPPPSTPEGPHPFACDSSHTSSAKTGDSDRAEEAVGGSDWVGVDEDPHPTEGPESAK